MKIRLNVNGNTVYGEKEDVLLLRHLDDHEARLYFTAAQENGMASFELKGKAYTLRRQPDYTYEVTVGKVEGSYFT